MTRREPLAPGLSDGLLRRLHRGGATVYGVVVAWGLLSQLPVQQRHWELGIGRSTPSRSTINETPRAADLEALSPMLLRTGLRTTTRVDRKRLPCRELLRTARAEIPRLRKRLADVERLYRAFLALPKPRRKLVPAEFQESLREEKAELLGDLAYARGAVASLTTGHASSWERLGLATALGYAVHGPRLDALTPDELREGATVHRVTEPLVGHMTSAGRRWVEQLRQAKRPRAGPVRRARTVRMAASSR